MFVREKQWINLKSESHPPVRSQLWVWPLHLWCGCNWHQDLLIQKYLNCEVHPGEDAHRPDGSPVTHVMCLRHFIRARMSRSRSCWTHPRRLFPASFKVTFLPSTAATTRDRLRHSHITGSLSSLKRGHLKAQSAHFNKRNRISRQKTFFSNIANICWLLLTLSYPKM